MAILAYKPQFWHVPTVVSSFSWLTKTRTSLVVFAASDSHHPSTIAQTVPAPELRVLVAAKHDLHGGVELDSLAVHGRMADILTVGEGLQSGYKY